jgi:DedD protein
MLTRPEAADPAVEDLKRRARRRLVGAVVLALAAAVILPLLLESDPNPLGDDVSIRIPPIDNGKFVTSLSPAKGPDAKATSDVAAPSASGKPAAPAPVAAVEPKLANPDASSGQQPGSAQRAPTGAVSAAAPGATGVVAASSAGGVTAADAEPQKAAVPAPKVVSEDTRPVVASPAGGFVVQLAAFADAKVALSLASKLKSAGFPAYTEASKTRQGTVRRVRVGPYASRQVADAELAKLNAAGYHGGVTTK